ncbi:MAG TPA: type II toxin-antitoxin system VapC family toxin [Thermoanaerobaculia bacterium]|nr:type II toxin-antitoxin system VapC family toxin [Thermoanaerobaculia bacterium]
MRPTVYVENSVVSYLTARRAQTNVRVAAHQDFTREWWNTRRHLFELYASAVVVEEAQDGDPSAAAARLELIAELSLLDVTPAARDLAAILLRETRLPSKATADALHIATAAVHGMDYLITWNCTHIANAVIFRSVEAVCRASGYEPPVMCTPEELMEP